MQPAILEVRRYLEPSERIVIDFHITKILNIKSSILIDRYLHKLLNNFRQKINK